MPRSSWIIVPKDLSNDEGMQMEKAIADIPHIQLVEKPRAPTTAYQYWQKGRPPGAAKWADVTEEKKESYSAQVEQDKRRHRIEQAAYDAQMKQIRIEFDLPDDKGRHWVNQSSYMVWGEAARALHEEEEREERRARNVGKKRVRGPFALYSMDNRPRIKEQHPGIMLTEMTKMLAEEWKNAPLEVKDRYRAQTEAERKQLAAENQQHAKDDDDDSDSDEDSDEKHQHSSSKPKRKRCHSAYMLFRMDNRARVKAEHPGTTTSEIIAMISEEWQEASEDVRELYEKRAQEERARLEHDNDNHNVNEDAGARGGDERPLSAAVPMPDPSESTAVAAFVLYTRDHLENLRREQPLIQFSDIADILAASWQQAPPELRARYQKEASEGKHLEREVKQEAKIGSTSLQTPNVSARSQADEEEEPAIDNGSDYIDTDEDDKRTMERRRKMQTTIKLLPKPQSAKSAEVLFAADHHQQAQAEHPNMPLGEVVKLVTQQWTNAAPEVKEHYERVAQQDQQRYDQQEHDYEEQRAVIKEEIAYQDNTGQLIGRGVEAKQSATKRRKIR